MTGYRGRRDPLMRLASSSSRRASVGPGAVGVSGVRRAVDPGGSGGATQMVGELHKIDWFNVTDDALATFTLSYAPLPGSWNVELNGVVLNEDTDDSDEQYAIAGRELTILDPADTFLGIAGQEPPWKLRVQYDYLFGVVATVVGSGLVVSGQSLVGSLDMLIPGATEIGDMMVAHIATDPAATLTVPSGWSLVANITQSGSFPYGSVEDYIYAKPAEAGDLGSTSVWTATDDLCGGIVVVPGGSDVDHIGANQSNLAAATPLAHPAASIPAGGMGLFFASVGNSLSGGLSMSGATSDWSVAVNFQRAAAGETLTAGGHSVTSTYTVEAARIAHTVVVT